MLDKNNIEILHPIFLHCKSYETDSFWLKIFDDLAKGVTPYGTYINKDYLTCNYKGKEFSYLLRDITPEDAHRDVKELLMEKLGIMSANEKIKRRQVFNDITTELKESKQSWSSIRKKNIKELLIDNFVIKMGKEYSLTDKQVKYLSLVINTLTLFKLITKKDIEYDDEVIISINGFEFEKGVIKIKDVVYNSADKAFEDDKDRSENFDKIWQKFLKDLSK